jgi:hypothetical protein
VNLAKHPQFSVQELEFGREHAPLLVIDNVVQNPEELVELAAGKHFGDVGSYFPGIRAKTPLSYQQFIIDALNGLFTRFFSLAGHRLRFTMCHFSLVTMPAEKLAHLQRIPHIDSIHGQELAFVHYLFHRDLGGTAFYRHRSTGFEYVDQQRKAEYFARVEEERLGPNPPAVDYIRGDSPLYEQIGAQSGIFNRMLVYRRNSLHSASLGPEFRTDPNPRTGRLSINGFLA